MDFSQALYNFGYLTGIITSLILFSLILWIIKRKKRTRQWLPTLRLLVPNHSQLPKMRFVPPPIFLFFTFLISSLMIVFLTMRPSQIILDSAKHGLSRTHVFIDLSPSISQKGFSEQARVTLENVYKELSKDDQLSFGISSSKNIYRPSSLEELTDFLKTLQIHRAGLKIGNAIGQQLEKTGDINRLIIVSDNDRYSWSDFNWQYLSERVSISRIGLLDDRADKANVFISQVSANGLIDKQILSWSLDIWGVGIDKPIKGNAKLMVGSKVVAMKQWDLTPKNHKLSISFEVRRNDLSKVFNAQKKKNEYLTWKINVEDPAYNYLLLDDEYRVPFRQVNQDVLISSQPSGEMFLEDGMHHLKLVLEILGFRVRRVDQLNEVNTDYWSYPFLIVSDGGGATKSFCPLIQPNRQSDFLTNVWLIPNPKSTNYKSLCHCYANLSGNIPQEDNAKLPSYCEDVETRDQYVGVLRSLGAKQIGGSVDDVLGSMAWEWENARSKIRILAFTIPLKPGLGIGVSYGELPSIIRNLLEWVGLPASNTFRVGANWPQIADITNFLEKQGISNSDLVVSNVPTSESLLQVQMEENLPSQLEMDELAKPINRSGVGKNNDPTPWLTLISMVLTIIATLEAIYLVTVFFVKRKRSLAQLVIFIFALNFVVIDPAQANTKINLFGYDAQGMSLSRLRNEVNGRTSIELSREILISDNLKRQIENQGWLWIRSPEKALGSDGSLNKELENWVKRGGFLIIEHLTNPNAVSLKSLGRDNEKNWKPIPPDHEIMRSFHLLESLPKCNGNVWYGYHFDSRVAIVGVPYSLINVLTKNNIKKECDGNLNFEDQVRIFINVLMVALTTGYKKDQIHLPEILKRLR